MRAEFWVPGVPVPKGSTRAFMRPGAKFPIVTNANPNTKAWEQAIRGEASSAGCTPDFTGPVRIEASFFFPRPMGHYGKQGVRLSAPRAKTTKPDLDKLTRALLDALTGVAFVDDSQVIELLVLKLWVRSGGVPGVEVLIQDADAAAQDGQGEAIDGRIVSDDRAEPARATEARGNAGGHST